MPRNVIRHAIHDYGPRLVVSPSLWRFDERLQGYKSREVSNVQEEAISQAAKGKICSRTVRDKEGRKIIGEGEVVTNAILQLAEERGVVDEVISCAGLTTLPPPESATATPKPVQARASATWQPSLPPAAQEMIEEEEEEHVGLS